MKKITIVLLAGSVDSDCRMPVAGSPRQWPYQNRGTLSWRFRERRRRRCFRDRMAKWIARLFESRLTKICCLTSRMIFPATTLHLRTREHVWPTHGIKVVISSPTRAGAKIRGAVKLIANKLSGPAFAVESKGASEVSLDGKIDRLLVDMTGASQLSADGLQTKTAEISTTGAGDADITVSETLKVVITGAGKVTYSGNPVTIQKSITGAGSIRRKD